MVRGIQQFTQIASVLIAGIAVTSTPAWAGCGMALCVDELQTTPCKGYIDRSYPEACSNTQGNNVASLCFASKIAQDNANVALTFAILHTVNAVICGTCIALDQVPNTRPAAQALAVACGALGMGLTAGELATTLAMNEVTKQYVTDAAAGRDNLLATLLPAGTGLVTTGTTFVGQVGKFNYQSGGTNSNNQSQGDASAVCVPGLLTSALQAGLKYYTMQSGIDSAREMVKPIPTINTCDTLPEACWQALSCTQHPKVPEGTTPPPPALAENITGNNPGSLGMNTYGSLYNRSGVTVGNVPSTADILGAAARDGALNNMPPQVNNALAEAPATMREHTGASFQDIGAALLRGKSPTDIVGSLVPQTAGTMAALGSRMPDVLNRPSLAKARPLTTRASDLFAAAKKSGGGKSAASNPLQDMLAGLLNQGKGTAGGSAATTGTSRLRFGAAEHATKAGDDVFHGDTSRSLFDIVSSRWAAITVRFIEEDRAASSGANPELASKATTGGPAPTLGSTLPPPGLSVAPATTRAPAGSSTATNRR